MLELLITADHQQIAAQPLTQIGDEGIAHQRHQGAAEHRCWLPAQVMAEGAVVAQKRPDVRRILKKQADRGGLLEGWMPGQQLGIKPELGVCCWTHREARTFVLLEGVCQMTAGFPFEHAVTDQNDGHRSRSSFESQPNPTTLSRTVRSRRRVRCRLR